MMYLLFNEYGAIKDKQINEWIVQGSNNVNKIGVAIDGVDSTSFALVGVCKLPNGEVITTAPVDEQAEIIDGVYGVVFSLSKDITALEGTLRINIQAINTTTDKIITSYTVYLCVNEGVDPGEIVMMTADQYQDLLSKIELDIQQDETILTFGSLPLASNYSVGQVIYVRNSSVKKLYECVNNNDTLEWHETFDFNDHYTKAAVDTMLNAKQDKLTVESLETAQLQYSVGFDAQGNLRKGAGGGGAVYTAGTGIEITDFTISVDTDVVATQDDLQNVREVAEGKCKAFVLSYQKALPTTDAQAQLLKKVNGDSFTSLTEFNTYVADLTYYNPNFAYSYNSIGLTATSYIITDENIVIRSEDMDDVFQVGDVIYITELDVPDRWLSTSGGLWVCNKLETAKVDLTNYVTLNTDQTITGVKTFSNGISIDDLPIDKVTNGLRLNEKMTIGSNSTYLSTNFLPYPNNTYDVGSSSYKWKDLYLNNAVYLAEIRPTSGQTVAVRGNFRSAGSSWDIGMEQYPFKDLYLSGKVYIYYNESGETEWNIARDNKFNLSFYAGTNIKYSMTDSSFIPRTNGLNNLGASAFRWRDLYLSGNLTDGTNSASIAQISNGIFNIINASDITNNTLTQEQYDTITNGKPTLIKGTFLNVNSLFILPAYYSFGTNILFMCFGNISTRYNISYFQINTSTKVCAINDSTKHIRLNNLETVNGKIIPNYPSSPENDKALLYGATGNSLYWGNIVPTNAYAGNDTTVLEYSTINNITLSANTTYTLATAPTGTYPEYKGYMVNSSGSDKTITLPTSVTRIKASSSLTVVQPVISGGSVITAGTVTIPDGANVEFNLQNGLIALYNWNE